MNTKIETRRVWDLPTRMFHWSLVASFLIAFLTSDSEKLRDVHVLAGYSLAGLITFRLLWGFVGGKYSRFADFLPTPQKLIDYLKSLLVGKPRHYVGHNPAGAVAIFLLLGFGAVAALSGWATYEEVGGHFMEELHETAANGMMALVVIHIVGVIVSSSLHRENLVLAMITGWKSKQGQDSAQADGGRS
ncbi:MAG: cytochrome b/b6 domain-containing protein [Burkholderiaceae bacterium]|nr:cytochrome b/b6 domain-containing protein [Sulfuritalea sp.]MCF8175964.1 cytochrome b/b6 domain-containing protein [Burkholderiaceae bacterium]MCF8183971.1 cytochrome b/b6 domain-containing protein [Polynucleobacter sp.]